MKNLAFLLIAAMAVTANAQQSPSMNHDSMNSEKSADVKPAPVPVNSAAWKQLNTLVGKWEGWTEEGGKRTAGSIDVRSTAGGSALMHWMAAGTPYEMVTMFHPDGDDILATHYCAAHNQPRLKLIPSNAANLLTFDFKDGTNILPGAGHMSRLVLIFIDADHHDEVWTYTEPGKPVMQSVFHYTRSKS